jgi:dTDP-4-amino-4,6-dideoxygalactose transaminase
MCDLRGIRAIADRHGLVVIEDAAHCLEGRRDGIRPGVLSEAACFSFYATKSITSGEGGALVTRDPALAEQLRILRQQGMTSGAAERERHGYRHRDLVTMGWKYNMSNLQAAILLPQLARLERNHQRRTMLAERYLEQLDRAPGVTGPHVRPSVEHAWHIFAVRVDDRDGIVSGLQRESVGVTVHYYPPVHLTAHFRRTFGYAPGAFPAAERIAATTISLPLYAAMPESHVDEVVRHLRRVVRSGADNA